MAEFEDNFESRLPEDLLPMLLGFGQELHFDPTSSVESEDYFLSILQEFHGKEHELERWLRQRLIHDFHAISSHPEWIQNPDWQYAQGKPMTFIGQINIPSERRIFHDDAAFYLFWNPETGETKTIIQVA